MILWISIILIEISLNLITNSYAISDITPNQLKCEYLINPLAIETQHPRLSWILEGTDASKQNLSQKAYQILVATDEKLLEKETADLWDTKKVFSNKSTHIPYNGLELKSRQNCFWKVRVWDQNDVMSELSSVAKWQMGLIGQNDWTAKWIGAEKGLQLGATKNLQEFDANVRKLRICQLIIKLILIFNQNSS